MKNQRLKRMVTHIVISRMLLFALISLTSCASIGNRLKPDDCLGNTLPKPTYLYGGVRCDIRFLFSPHNPEDLWALALVDLPLSLVADTLFLPWATVDYVTRKNPQVAGD